MVVFSPEIHSFLLKPFIDYVNEQLGDEKLNQILSEFGTTKQDLSDSTAWVSLEFYEEFTNRVLKIFNDPRIFDHCARLALSPKYMGFLRPLFRTLGSPMVGYSQVVGGTGRFNKIGHFRLEKLGPSHIKLIYTSLPNAPKEQTDVVCQSRIAQLAALATIFDLPPADVEHPDCMLRGDPACIYDLQWKLPRQSKATWIGLSFGSIGGAALSIGAGVSLGIGSVLTLLSGTSAWSFTKISSLKREISERADDLLQQQEALTAATKRHEERYEELLQAKQATEQTVEERTRELRQTSEELEIANIQLKSLDELKSQFIANVSHELRTPLTLTLGPIENLLNTESDPQRRRDLETVYRNQQRLYKLIDDLLDFTRLEAGKTDLRFSKEDVAEHVRYMASTLEAATKSRNIRFTIEVPNTSVWIYADRDKLEKIVMNLLSNAFKFTPDGGSIGIHLLEQANYVQIEIQDTGPGIPNDKLMSIFDRFSQVDSSQTRRFGGTGIGLAMVREYTEMHGGSVDVKSVLGQGSTFSVQFRKGKKHLDAALINEETSTEPELRPHLMVEFAAEEAELEVLPAPSLAEQASAPAQSLKQLRTLEELEFLTQQNIDALMDSLQRKASILIVDDQADMRKYLYSILRTEYSTIYIAKDGLEALEIVRNFQPNLVISDVMMPRMSGEELCKAIKSEPGRLSRTPVILLTARAGTSSKLEGLKLGANDYLIKPFQADELKLRVHNMLHDRLKEQALFAAHQKLSERSHMLDEDLEMAGAFQRTLLPEPKLPKGINFHAVCRLTEQVGGDIYDICQISPQHIRVFIIDVNGHGVRASIRAGVVFSLYRSLISTVVDPGDMLLQLNLKLIGEHKQNIGMSACCIDIHFLSPDKIKLRYSQTWELPLFISLQEDVREAESTSNLMLGIVEDVDFVTNEIELSTPIRFICFTDGIKEQKNRIDKEFETDAKYKEAISRLANPNYSISQVVETFVEACDDFRGDVEQADDITVIGFEIESPQLDKKDVK